MLGILSILPGCTDPQYPADTSPFSCVGTASCPAGYDCMSGLCVPAHAPALPAVVARSAASVALRSYADVDRQGMITCFMAQEDLRSPTGSIHASFMSSDGQVSQTVPLFTFDTQNSIVLGTCAPIPHTGGRILIAVWQQSTTGAPNTRINLHVWTPDQPNGLVGSVQPFYSEPCPDQRTVPSRYFEVDVAESVFVPVAWQLQEVMPGHGLPINLSVLTVGAADLAAGMPHRQLLNAHSNLIYADTSSSLRAGPTGLFFHLGYTQQQVGFYMPTGGGLLANSPESAFGSINILATSSAPNAAGVTADEAALSWIDPLEGGSGQNYRVAWLRALTSIPRLGPRLPFRRSHTPQPAAFVIGSDLYVLGAVVGTPLPPAGLDGGMAADAAGSDDGGSADAATDTGAVASSESVGPLTVYRTRWGADPGDSFTEVATVGPRVANAQVTSVSAARIPGHDRLLGVAWTEFYPPDAAGHGARYVVYSKDVTIP